MRSTQLVMFLVMMNVAAGIVAVGMPGDVTPAVGGDSEIDQASNDVKDQDFSRIPGSELVAAFFSLGSLIQDIRTIVFYGPEMLGNLGAPGILVGGFEVVLTFVVGFDIAEAVTGRRLS